jgi:hypothetical protein
MKNPKSTTWLAAAVLAATISTNAQPAKISVAVLRLQTK